MVVAVLGLGIAAGVGTFDSKSGAPIASRHQAAPDGVHVHGNWTVVVRDGHGKVVRRAVFHNDFVTGLGSSGGDAAFAAILSHQNTPGAWDVSIQGAACPADNGNFCQMFEPGSNPSFFAADADTKNLTITVPSSGTDAFKIVLQGDVHAANTGTITRVGSGLQICPSTATVGADCGHGYNEITDRNLSGSPISVAAGQDISVTVKLSFS